MFFALRGMFPVLTGYLFVFSLVENNTRLRAVISFRPVSDLVEEGSHEKVGGHGEHGKSEKRGNHKEVGGWKEKGRCEKQRSRKEKGSNKGQRSRKGHQQVFQNPVAEPV